MPKRIHKTFPQGDACPTCGRRLTMIYDRPNYKEAICNSMKGHCGWWGYLERGAHRKKTSELVP